MHVHDACEQRDERMARMIVPHGRYADKADLRHEQGSGSITRCPRQEVANGPNMEWAR